MTPQEAAHRIERLEEEIERLKAEFERHRKSDHLNVHGGLPEN